MGKGSDSRLSSGSDDIGNSWLQQDMYQPRANKTPKKASPVPTQKARPTEVNGTEKAKQMSPWMLNGSKVNQERKGSMSSTTDFTISQRKEDEKIQFLKHYFQSTNP